MDPQLLDRARRSRPGVSDARLIDEALATFLAAAQSEVIDQHYAHAYGESPMDAPDAWGDLGTFANAVRSR